VPESEPPPEAGRSVPDATPERPRQGDRAAAISKAIVRVYAEYVGRGPTRARTVISGNIVTVIAEDILTTAEARLVAEGASGSVVDLRRKFQGTMRGALTNGVEEVTGRNVVAFLSGHQADPDYACEVFVLESGEPGEPQPKRA